MFRHSEIQAILRKRRHERENSDSSQHRKLDMEAARGGQNLDVEQESLSGLEDEDEYARFLEQEQEQLRENTVVKKRKRSGNVDRTRYHTSEEDKDTARELGRMTVSYDSLDYGDDTAVRNPITEVVDEHRTQLEHGRKRIVYEDEEGVETVISIAGGQRSGMPAEKKMFLWPKIQI